MSEFYVQICKMENNEVVEKMGPMSERKADRVEMGALINLDRDNYYVETVEAQ